MIDLLAHQACNVREHFWTLHLDIGSRLIAVELVGIGSQVDMELSPAECVRSALLTGACSIILVHCHPSGNPEPSDHDISATTRLVQAAELVGLLVEDHIIIAKGGFFSFREQKLL